MLQSCGDVNLGEKSFRAKHSRELGMHDFDCDLAMMSKVFREVDRCHSALAELALDCVFVRKCCGEPVERFSHLFDSQSDRNYPASKHRFYFKPKITRRCGRKFEVRRHTGPGEKGRSAQSLLRFGNVGAIDCDGSP